MTLRDLLAYWQGAAERLCCSLEAYAELMPDVVVPVPLESGDWAAMADALPGSTPEGQGPGTREPHLYVRTEDSPRSVRRYFRTLHVCPAINPDGVHLAVSIDLDGPPPGAEGHEKQKAAGLNLTPEQARGIVAHMQAILDGQS